MGAPDPGPPNEGWGFTALALYLFGAGGLVVAAALIIAIIDWACQ